MRPKHPVCPLVAFCRRKKTPFLCSIILNSTQAKLKTKDSMIDSKSLLAIGQEVIQTWKMIPWLHFPSQIHKMAVPLWWRFQLCVCKNGSKCWAVMVCNTASAKRKPRPSTDHTVPSYTHLSQQKISRLDEIPAWSEAWTGTLSSWTLVFSAVPRLTLSDCQSPCCSAAPRLRCHLPFWPLTSLRDTGATNMLKFLSDMDQWLQSQCDPEKINTGVYLVGVWEARRL